MSIDRQFGGASTRARACSEHGAAEKDEVRYPVGTRSMNLEVLLCYHLYMSSYSKNIYSLPFPKGTLITNIWRNDPSYKGPFPSHTGPFITAIDFEMATGNKVIAPLDGRVISVVDGNTAYGPSRDFAESVNYITLEHNNSEYSQYLHLANGTMTVHKGDIVKRGQLLAKTGLSGWMNAPHLHWFVFVYDDSPEKFSGIIPRMDAFGSRVLLQAK